MIAVKTEKLPLKMIIRFWSMPLKMRNLSSRCGGFERPKGLRKLPGKELPALPARFRAGTDTAMA
jgi:hypothetical protein